MGGTWRWAWDGWWGCEGHGWFSVMNSMIAVKLILT
jgi:hypothetical protein